MLSSLLEHGIRRRADGATRIHRGVIDRMEMGGSVPHFQVRAHDGSVVDYSTTIWQRRHLVLVAVPSTKEAEHYLHDLLRHTAAFNEHECSLVLTADPIPGLPAPGLAVADRWGEIVHLVTAKTAADLPNAATLLQWVEAIDHRCPECEGEAR